MLYVKAPRVSHVDLNLASGDTNFVHLPVKPLQVQKFLWPHQAARLSRYTIARKHPLYHNLELK